MNTLKIAVCDDDRLTLKSEVSLLNNVLKSKQISHTVHSFFSPAELLRSNTLYDIVFLEVKIGKSNGIDIARILRRRNNHCLIFFVTNYPSYMDAACNEHAFRFWTKPIDENRLIYGINSAIKELNRDKQYITVTWECEKTRILVKNIIYVFAADRKTHIVTTGGDFVTNTSYQSIMEKLIGYGMFFETYRSYGVNFNYVHDYNKETVVCGHQNKKFSVPISRRRQSEFSKKFAQWIGDF